MVLNLSFVLQVSAMETIAVAKLSVKNWKTVDSVQSQAKMWYEKNIDKSWKEIAHIKLQAIFDKLTLLQWKQRVDSQSQAVVFSLRIYIDELLNPVMAPVETKQLTKEEIKKVNDVMMIMNSQKDPSVAVIANTMRNLQSLWLSKMDSELLTMKLENTMLKNSDGFEFCANFTPELYPIEAQYNDAQSANSKQFDKLALRVIHGGNVWFINESPDLYTSRMTSYRRIADCAHSLYGQWQNNNININQTYVKNLMNKLGKSYVIQNKPFYNINLTDEEIQKWDDYYTKWKWWQRKLEDSEWKEKEKFDNEFKKYTEELNKKSIDAKNLDTWINSLWNGQNK